MTSPTASATKTAWQPGTWAVDAALLTVTLVWGINNVAVKTALQGFSPLSFNALRFAIASTLAMGLLLITERRVALPRPDLALLFGIGFLGNTVYQVGFIKGMALSTAGNVSFVLATMPATTALLGFLLRVEVLPWRAWAGLATTLGGALLIIASGGGGSLSLGGATARGDILVLAGTLGWCLYTILSRRILDRYTPLRLTAWTMVLGTIPLVALSVPELRAQDWSRPAPLHWACLAGSAALALVFAYVVWNWGLSRIGTARTAIYGNITPLWTGFFGWLLLREVWAPARVAGAALILLGVGMVRSSKAGAATPAVVCAGPVASAGSGQAAAPGLAERP
ncbi:MAG: DMT family transporter [Bacillota bacterium]|nr:DMT family transporter [Bacillota bacterium]